MNEVLDLFSDRLLLAGRSPGLSLMEIAGDESEAVAELMARLALQERFEIIPGGEWLPHQVSMHRAVRRHTAAVNATLDRIHLMRPFTCLQMEDLLSRAARTDAAQPAVPLLVLDFLHHFHNADVDLALRLRVLEKCCRYLERAALVRPVAVFVRYLPGQEYEDFLPSVLQIADHILQIQEVSSARAFQPGLFEEMHG